MTNYVAIYNLNLLSNHCTIYFFLKNKFLKLATHRFMFVFGTFEVGHWVMFVISKLFCNFYNPLLSIILSINPLFTIMQ
jgi:hypothetical protein